MRERDIERYLGRRVKEAGGMSIKLAPTIVGLPDRLVVLPGGVMHLVELKRPGGRLSPAQRLMHDRLQALGVPVAVLWSREDVDEWMESGSDRG